MYDGSNQLNYNFVILYSRISYNNIIINIDLVHIDKFLICVIILAQFSERDLRSINYWRW